MNPICAGNYCEVPRISLDINEWYTISFAVIHSNDVVPRLNPVGKVIGQKEINIVELTSQTDSFWGKLFYGDLNDNLIRLVLSFIILLIMMVILEFIFSAIDKLVNKNNRHKIKNRMNNDPRISSLVKADYESSGDKYVSMAYRYYGLGETDLNKLYEVLNQFIYSKEKSFKDDFDKRISMFRDLTTLIAKGYLKMDENNKVIIPRDIQISVNMVKKIVEKTENHLISFLLMPRTFDSLNVANIEDVFDYKGI